MPEESARCVGNSIAIVLKELLKPENEEIRFDPEAPKHRSILRSE